MTFWVKYNQTSPSFYPLRVQDLQIKLLKNPTEAINIL